MKKLLLGLACLLSFTMQAMEYEKQFENDQVSVAKVTVLPHEEIGPHRDAYPRVIVALKGGTVTRIEADGSTKDIHFPTGVGVFLEADPENELHRGINHSSEPIEAIIVLLKNPSHKEQTEK